MMAKNNINSTKTQKLTKLIHGLLTYVVAAFMAFFIGGMIIFAVLWLVILQLGYNPYTENSTMAQNAQTVFWVGLWTAIACLYIVKQLRKRKSSPFALALKNALLVSTIIGVFSALILSVNFAIQGEEERVVAENTCSLSTTLRSAMAASYPIGTNLGSGTGFAINDSGNILTAYHVIEGADRIYLNLATGDIPLKVLKVVPEYDLALLQSPQSTPAYLTFDQDYDQSDDVYAVGWPGNTFTAGGASASVGVVSRVLKNEDLKLSGDTPRLLEVIQTDAAVNPGNSGGALISNCGAVGVVTWMSDRNQLGEYGFASEQGISYAVSSRTIKKVFGF